MTYLFTAVASLAVGWVLGWFTHFNTIRRERDSRLRRFKSEILKWLAECQRPDTNPVEFHKRTMHPVSIACAEASVDLNGDSGSNINKARVSYENLSQDEIENFSMKPVTAALFHRHGQERPEAGRILDMELGRERIVELLNQMLESAS